MIVDALKQNGIDPELIRQFLAEHVQIAQQINDDLVNELSPLDYQRNTVMLGQVKLLMVLLDE